MNVITSNGSGLLYRVGASRAGIAAPSNAAMPRARSSDASELSTRVTLGESDGRSAVYSDPRAKSGAARVWSSPVKQNDAVSAVMARNQDLGSYTLGDQWRGLGGAMLARFAKTGESYSQTLADDFSSINYLNSLTPEAQAQRAPDVAALQAAALSNVATHAPTAKLKIQTRSGQALELKITVNSGFGGIISGMKVELQASGSMSAAERAAVERLADGLDRALEGLGRDDAVNLDLAGLMSYDHDAISSVDLAVNNTQSHQVLGAFALHLGDDKQSISLKGGDGEMSLNVGIHALGNSSKQQRDTAIQSTLDRMGRAGERGHANTALVEQMKAAFKAFQAAAVGDGAGKDTFKADALAASAEAADAASKLSGLADFDASFGGDTYRRNRFGSNHEAGQAHYQLSQTSTSKDSGNGDWSVAQTVAEQLSADFRTATGADAMLDVRTGQYSTTSVRDSSAVTTLIESAADHAIRVLRKTDESQLKTVTDAPSDRTATRHAWPSQRSVVERLH